jgi:hypothetical protein
MIPEELQQNAKVLSTLSSKISVSELVHVLFVFVKSAEDVTRKFGGKINKTI